MPALARVRLATAFDPAFLAKSPLFWPLERAARALGLGADFPPVEALGAVFADPAAPPVRFVPSAPRARPRRGAERTPVDPSALYDARITRDRVVPTRPASWHDFMNALVWGTFPRAKAAVHARQHRAIAERLIPGAVTLPPNRTRELDALALVDEGGVLLLAPDGAPDEEGIAVVFGHAVYESLALGVASTLVAALRIPYAGPADAPALIDAADAGLARVLADPERLGAPGEMRRLDLGSHPRATPPAAS